MHIQRRHSPWLLFYIYLVMLTATVFANAATSAGLPLSEVAGGPATQIGGHVNAVTGTYSEQHTDILLLGAEPLGLSRYYNSMEWSGGNLADGWSHNFGHRAIVSMENRYCTITYPHLSGGMITFIGNKKADINNYGAFFPKENCLCTLDRADLELGLTNCSSGEITGRDHLKNTQIVLSKPAVAYATAGDGSLRQFTPIGACQGGTLPCHLFLRAERKPSGNLLAFSYAQDRDLQCIATTNAAGKPLNWISFERCKFNKNLIVRTSENKTIQYRNVHLLAKGEDSVINGRYRLSEVINPDQPTTCYQYSMSKYGHEQMTRRAGPDGRFLEVAYFEDMKGTPYWMSRRVFELRAPVGTDGTAVMTHRFTYPSQNCTEVIDAQLHKTVYQSENQRLTQITHYLGTTDTTYAPYSSERFYWGDQNSSYRSDLICKALVDASGAVRSCRVLAYDTRHNVTEETLYGNLSGHSTVVPVLDSAGRPVANGCEGVTTHYTYSADGYNLLLTETEENGRNTIYRYKPNTDLLISRLVSDGTKIVSREFHTYNEDSIRIRSVADDGCGRDEGDLAGVTVRLIDTLQPRMEAPGVGLPIAVEQRYLDLGTGAECLLGRRVNHYDDHLHLVQQDCYDADNQLRYSLTWEYDAMGNVIAETNALGQVTQRQFDANCNKIFEQSPSNLYATRYAYDFMNRCICEEKIYPDGTKRTHSNNYDTLNQKVVEVDHLGNETRYTYDSQGRVTQIELPDNQGTRTVTRQEYDLAGNVIASVDGHGHRKEMTYTILGKVASIHHPDGSTERFVYNRDGTLARATAVNGLETVYTYDTLGNVLRKEHLSSSGTFLSATSAVYKGTRLLSETDANGNTTVYSYDGAGRQTAIVKPDGRTTFEYDPLGRRHVTREYSDGPCGQCRVTRIHADLLDRTLSETIDDGQGRVLKITQHAYDVVGNRISTTQVIGDDQAVATTMTDYDADHRPVRVTDPLGHVSVIEYDDTVRNSCGQRIQQTRTSDALGNQTWITHNVLGQVIEELRKDSWGQITAKRQHRYDANGNVVETVETVIVDGTPLRDVLRQSTYDCMNRNVSTTEAVGTAEQRITHQCYNNLGQQEALLLPDGLSLHFLYDEAGRLREYYSSDASVNYLYSYDANGNVIQVDDRKESTLTRRTYDASNRIASETLGNGLSVIYQYDGFGRVLQVTLPDHSAIRYHYNPLSLETVERLDAQGARRYAHTYTDFDLLGHSGRSILAGRAGEVTFTKDLMGRPLQMTSTYVNETIAPDGYDAVGNLTAKQIKDPKGTTDCRYGFDSLYQLTQESGVAQHRYRYDSLNNRLEKDSDGYQVNALNELQRAGSKTYRYDARGCRIAEEGPGNVTYHYDALNRLVRVEKADQCLTYTYDSFNRRLSAITSTRGWSEWTDTRRDFLYVGQDEIGSLDEQGKIVELRLLGTGRGAEIGATVAIEIGDRIYASLADSSGNIIALINASDGTFAEGYRYSAFGEVAIYDQSWWPFSSARTQNPWQFSSKRVDPGTSFVYFGRRYYDPALGRWITPDPLGYKAGPNLYAYVMNNPLTHFDAYGLYSEKNNPYCDGNYSFMGPVDVGTYNALLDPWGTCCRYGGYASQLGSSIWNRDFSSLSQGWDQIRGGHGNFFKERMGEIVTVVTLAPVALASRSAHAVEAGASYIGRVASGLVSQGVKAGMRWAFNRQNAAGELTSEAQASPQIGRSPNNIEGSLTGKNFKPFTKSHYRHNLKVLTDTYPPRNIEAHHVFPQRFNDNFFSKKGINVHDPKYLTWWEKTSHRPSAKQYNSDWLNFVENNPNATQAQILQKGKELMYRRGIKTNY